MSGPVSHSNKVVVLGLGKAGCRIVDNLFAMPEASWLSCVAIDTDQSSLDDISVSEKIVAASDWRKGEGCGGDVLKGERSISKERSRISAVLEGASFLFVLGGLGGGTATGGATIIASIAHSMGIPSLFMMTVPFSFEGHVKRMVAEKGIQVLLPSVDILIPLPNDLLFSSLAPETEAFEAFASADNEVAYSMLGVCEMLRCDNMLSADFADFRMLLAQRKNLCGIGVGLASGEDTLARGHLAIERMLASPLLGGASHIELADAVIVSITGGSDLQIGEMKRVLEVLERITGKDTKMIVGVNTDSLYDGKVQITVITVEFDKDGFPVEDKKQTAGEVRDTVARRTLSKDRGGATEQLNLPLQNISRGIFFSSLPTMIDGEDFDIPTFQRESIEIDRGR